MLEMPVASRDDLVDVDQSGKREEPDGFEKPVACLQPVVVSDVDQ